jgi:hypothetical protein
MDEAAVNRLLAGLVASDDGWTASVPAESGRLLGHPVGIVLQTRHVRKDGPPPAPDEPKLALARQVLASLPEVLAVAEREFAAYAGADDGDPALVANPHVWLFLDEYEEAGPGRWAFVVGFRDAPFYGVHVEFDGLAHLETWGGD